MARLEGKVAIVTGGNRGIGAGIARAFAREGAAVVLAARDAEKLQQTAAELEATGATVLGVPTDVTDEAGVESLFQQAMERFGRVDILVNNAGAFDGGPIDELSLETWEKVMAVNLRGPFLCTRAAFRIMKAQGGGRIINVASISAQRVRMNSGPYSTSKHGLWGLTQCTALEGRPFGIAASCLHPGNTENDRRALRATEADQEPMMTCDELAETALLMASLPPHVNMLEAIVLPVEQLYVGRG
ncbi:MAG: short-chain dehydrogenase/reductase [Armatimonadetes bacterium]|jgi:NAD(P)-dependent dehydrogenase (short-subunit alcohol dehydrogenase family)|nr:short-chain dehydrogenase/reductase [Armatimonadota bacterium]